MFYDGWQDGLQDEYIRKPITVLYTDEHKTEAIEFAKVLYRHCIPYEMRLSTCAWIQDVKLILAGGFGNYSLSSAEDLFIYNIQESMEILNHQKRGELLISEAPLQKPVDFALLHRLHSVIKQQEMASDQYYEERYPYYSSYVDPASEVPYDEDDDRDVAYAEMMRYERMENSSNEAKINAELDAQLARIGNVLTVLIDLYCAIGSKKPS